MIIPEPADRTISGARPPAAHDDEAVMAGRPDESPCASFDYIDEEIEESMIASDPPSSTPVTSIGPPGRGRGPAERP